MASTGRRRGSSPRGATPVSRGCDHCWSAAETRVRAGQKNPKISGPKKGLVTDGRFNGNIRLRPENIEKPLHARKPRVYAVWNDLFHEDVPFVFVDRAFEIMDRCHQHIFLILTKRPDRMLQYAREAEPGVFPYANAYFGVSVEDQRTANERIPLLLQTPAVKRFVSYEPMLGPVDLSPWLFARDLDGGPAPRNPDLLPCLDWAILGGETGPGARPLHPDWVRKVRDQCQAAGVPFWSMFSTSSSRSRSGG